jgi:hypothetical protein
MFWVQRQPYIHPNRIGSIACNLSHTNTARKRFCDGIRWIHPPWN